MTVCAPATRLRAPIRCASIPPGGAPVLLVNTDGDYRYVGRLVVDFDDQGVVIPGSVDAINQRRVRDGQAERAGDH